MSVARQANGYGIESAPHASTGYIGKWGGTKPMSPTGGRVSNQSETMLRSLRDQGFQPVPWDGTGIYVVDSANRVIVGGGTPQDQEGWRAVVEAGAAALVRARAACSFTEKAFQLWPRDLHTDLDRSTPLLLPRRIAGFQSSLFHAYAPRLWNYYHKATTAILTSQPELQPNFANSVYSSVTFNCGPQTVTVPHIDYLNLAGGLCAITALGDFDPDAGGHLILWDLRIVLRFPPGATILIPSSLISHSNVPIQNGEQQFSITQYSAGGLFRWADNGLCSDAQRRRGGKPVEERWKSTMDLFERR